MFGSYTARIKKNKKQEKQVKDKYINYVFTRLTRRQGTFQENNFRFPERLNAAAAHLTQADRCCGRKFPPETLRPGTSLNRKSFQ